VWILVCIQVSLNPPPFLAPTHYAVHDITAPVSPTGGMQTSLPSLRILRMPFVSLDTEVVPPSVPPYPCCSMNFGASPSIQVKSRPAAVQRELLAMPPRLESSDSGDESAHEQAEEKDVHERDSCTCTNKPKHTATQITRLQVSKPADANPRAHTHPPAHQHLPCASACIRTALPLYIHRHTLSHPPCWLRDPTTSHSRPSYVSHSLTRSPHSTCSQTSTPHMLCVMQLRPYVYTMCL